MIRGLDIVGHFILEYASRRASRLHTTSGFCALNTELRSRGSSENYQS